MAALLRSAGREVPHSLPLPPSYCRQVSPPDPSPPESLAPLPLAVPGSDRSLTLLIPSPLPPAALLLRPPPFPRLLAPPAYIRMSLFVVHVLMLCNVCSCSAVVLCFSFVCRTVSPFSPLNCLSSSSTAATSASVSSGSSSFGASGGCSTANLFCSFVLAPLAVLSALPLSVACDCASPRTGLVLGGIVAGCPARARVSCT